MNKKFVIFYGYISAKFILKQSLCLCIDSIFSNWYFITLNEAWMR